MKNLLFILALMSAPAFGQRDNAGSGRAIQFDGVDDYIDLGNIYDDVALPITISAWVYIEPDPVVKQYPIFDSQDYSTVYNGFTFVSSTIPHVGFTIGDGKGGNNPAFRRSRAGYFNTLGKWFYVTSVARSGTDIQTYMNGHDVGAEYQGTSPYPMNSYSPTEVAKIGYYFGNGIEFWFKGVMDELRIWNRALTPTEIRASMCHRLKGDEDGLIGYWNFDETGGDQVFDLSPNGFHGAMRGSPVRVYSGAPVGDESVFLYTADWSGKTLASDDLTVSAVSGNVYGVHLYTVNHAPSQNTGLEGAGVAFPYYGVYLADDSHDNTFDVTLDSACDGYQRADNSQPVWVASTVFAGIRSRVEIIRGYEPDSFEINLGEDLTLCNERSLRLNATNDASGKTFQWNTGASTSEITVSGSGTYAVKVADDCRVAYDTIEVTFLSAPPAFSLGADQEACTLEPRILKPNLEDNDTYDFVWQDGSGDKSFRVTDFGTYSLKLQNDCGVSGDTITFHKKMLEPTPQFNFISPDSGDDLISILYLMKIFVGRV